MENVWSLRSFTLMPEHRHILLRLGENGILEKTVRLFKGRLSPILRGHNLHWQKGGFYDHKLRPNDSLEAVCRVYLYESLSQATENSDLKWPYFYCCPADWAWGKNRTNKELPYPEWLKHLICHGTMSFLAADTVMPAMIKSLGGSNWLIVRNCTIHILQAALLGAFFMALSLYFILRIREPRTEYEPI